MPGRSNNQKQQDQPQDQILNQPNGPLVPEEVDEDIEGGPLKINELISSSRPQRRRNPDDNRREVIFAPQTRSLDEIVANAVMAVDKDGNQYTGDDQIKKKLSEKGSQLFVFDNDGEPPYAYENRNGKLFCSNQGISSKNQLPGHFFVPAGSLDTDMILGGPSAERIIKLNYDYVSAKKKYDTESVDLLRQQKELNKQIEELKKKQPKLKVKEPKEPTFSWLQTVQRWAYKIITLGQGETAAYRKYQEDKASYPERNAKYLEAFKKYQSEEKKYKEEKQILDNRLIEIEADLREINVPVKNATELRDNVIGSYQKGRAKGTSKIRAYRENIEVLLEGTADIIKEGKITKDNIFANTWMKKAACEAKDPSDPYARQALEEYLVSKMAEEKMLRQSMSGDLDRRISAENESMLRSLNDGSAVKQLREDEVYQDVINEVESMGDLIDPEEIFDDLTRRMGEKAIEKASPLGKLETAKKQLIDNFGKKPITEENIKEVMDLNKLNVAIANAKKDPNYTVSKAYDVIADLYVDPGKQRVYYSDSMTEQETRKTIQSLQGKQDGKTFTLDEMTKLINDTHQAQKKKPQPSGPIAPNA